MSFEHQLNQSPEDLNVQPLCGGLLLKALETDESKPWRFNGIASDENEDVEGDSILRKALDLSYAKQRGYVNWDHKRDPEYQIGTLTKADIVPPSQVKELRKAFPQIGSGASVYVEGELYKAVPKAIEVYNIMKSLPEGTSGLGLSLDGSIARDVKSGGIVRAYVRGVAITAQPVQPLTMLKLKKSLEAYNLIAETAGLPANLPAAIAAEVVEQLKKSASESSLSHDQAVMFVLQQRPRWSYDLASKVVSYTLAQKTKGN